MTHNFNPTAELVIHIEVPRREAKAQKEKHPLVPEAKIQKCSR